MFLSWPVVIFTAIIKVTHRIATHRIVRRSPRRLASFPMFALSSSIVIQRFVIVSLIRINPQRLSSIPPRLVQQLDTLVRPRTRRQRVTAFAIVPPFIRHRGSTMKTINNNNNRRRRVQRVNSGKKRRMKEKTGKKRMEMVFFFESSNESFVPHLTSCLPSGISSSRYHGGY